VKHIQADSGTRHVTLHSAHGDDNELLSLYAMAVTHCERAQAVVQQVIVAVEGGELCESQSATLQQVCSEIAAVEQRIQAIQIRPTPRVDNPGHALLAAAEKHIHALNQVCERVRAAERAAQLRLEQLRPHLDRSIRGQAMVAAYGQHPAR
jgi:hypothetical protein